MNLSKLSLSDLKAVQGFADEFYNRRKQLWDLWFANESKVILTNKELEAITDSMAVWDKLKTDCETEFKSRL